MDAQIETCSIQKLWNRTRTAGQPIALTAEERAEIAGELVQLMLSPGSAQSFQLKLGRARPEPQGSSPTGCEMIPPGAEPGAHLTKSMDGRAGPVLVRLVQGGPQNWDVDHLLYVVTHPLAAGIVEFLGVLAADFQPDWWIDALADGPPC